MLRYQYEEKVYDQPAAEHSFLKVGEEHETHFKPKEAKKAFVPKGYTLTLTNRTRDVEFDLSSG